MVHDDVEVLGSEVGQNSVHGVLQSGVALDHRDADVDVTGVHGEIITGTGEVQNDQALIGGAGAHSGGHVGADKVHGAADHGHDHGGGAFGLGHHLGAGDLGQTGVIPDGAGLRSAGAGQVGDAGGSGLHDHRRS